MSQSLSPSQFRRLVLLNKKMARVLNFAAAPNRNPTTGAFTSGTAVTGPALRAAWGLATPNRAAMKSQLLAALRAPRAPRV